MIDLEKTDQYPSDFVPNEDKSDKSYGLQYVKAMWSEYKRTGTNLFSRAVRRYAENEKYRMGRQDTSKYKKHFDHLKGMLGKNKTLINLDYEVVSVIPNVIDKIIGSLEKRGINIICRAMDPQADNERMAYLHEMEAFMDLVSEGWIEEYRSAIGTPMPGPDEVPQSKEELDADVEYDYKAPYEVMAETGIDMVFQMNEWMEEFKLILEDLCNTAIGGSRTYVDEKGKIVCRRVDPKRAVVDYTNDRMFRNLRHAGEVLDMRADEFARLAGNDISQEQIQQIVSSQGIDGFQTVGNDIGDITNLTSYYEHGKTYDAYTIKVMHFCFYRTNRKVYKRKNTKIGSRKIEEAEFGYKPSGSYERDEFTYRVYYEGFWVIGTDHIFRYKLGENMPTKPGSISECVLPFQFYCIGLKDGDAKSIVERAKPLADDYMIYRLKLMAAILKSPPPGFMVHPEAIMNVMKGDGEYYEPLEIIELYLGTGVAFAATRNDAGEYLGDTFKELKGGLPPEVMQYTELMMHKAKEIQDICGVTQAAMGQAPERQSVTSTKLSVESTSDSIQGIISAAEYITKKTGEKVISLLQLMVKDGTIKRYVNGIGTSNGKYAEITKDIRPHDFGIFPQFEADEQEWADLITMMKTQMEMRETGNKPGITVDDYLFVRRIRNLKRAELEFRRRLEMRKREMQEHEKQMEELRSKTGQDQIMAAAEAEAEKLKKKLEMEEIYAQKKHERDIELLEKQLGIQSDLSGQIQSQKYELQYMLDEMKEQAKRRTELDKIEEKAKEDREIAEMNNESKERIAAKNAKRADVATK